MLSSASDDKGRTVVTDYFKDGTTRVSSGTFGLRYNRTSLLTNDGEFSSLMTLKHHVEKNILPKLKESQRQDKMRQLERGIVLDGRKRQILELKFRYR